MSVFHDLFKLAVPAVAPSAAQLRTAARAAYAFALYLILSATPIAAQVDTPAGSNVVRYQALVDGLLSTRHAMRVDELLRNEPYVLRSRTDHATRNIIIDVEGASAADPLRINTLLERAYVGLRCIHRTSVDQPFTPLVEEDCSTQPATTPRGVSDWELCVDPYETEGWQVDFGSEAHIATLDFEPFCCDAWDQYCQDIYDAFIPVGSNCDAVIPDHVDMNSPAFASTISTDPFCCSYEWDSFCDDLYNWSIPPLGCDSYTLEVSGGTVPGITWNFVGGTTIVGSGGGNVVQNLCMLSGCFSMIMLSPDSANGWGGATWTLYDASFNTVATGGMATGQQGAALVPVGHSMEYCLDPPVDPTDPGGGGPIGPPPASASDCPGAVPVCTNLSFQIEPNGWGEVYEIPALGSISNPDYHSSSPSPWPGNNNFGCLWNRERNSTWMLVNIWEGGSLEFTFGGLGTQVGFYDWAMYPYNASTCPAVVASTIPPVRCNWNGVSYGGTGLGSPNGGNPSNYEAPLNVLAGERYLIYFSNWSHVSTSVPLVFGGTAVVDCRDVTLPIELLAFSAAKEQGRVRLEWTSATEQNTQHYSVQRSTDLRSWERIATVAAAGSSVTLQHYSTLDREPLSGTSYYRLKMVDKDESFAYSPVVAVERLGTLRVYPNPSQGSFQIEGLPPGAQVEVLDMLGRILYLSINTEESSMNLRLPNTQAGLHLLRVTHQGQQTVQQLSVLPQN